MSKIKHSYVLEQVDHVIESLLLDIRKQITNTNEVVFKDLIFLEVIQQLEDSKKQIVKGMYARLREFNVCTD